CCCARRISRHSRLKGNLPPAVIDANQSGFIQPVEAVTAPPPLFRRADQSALHRIVVHVAELLDSFLAGPDVEIIKACLPEGQARPLAEQLPLTRVAALLFRQQSVRGTLL